jgi:hypothetical protein
MKSEKSTVFTSDRKDLDARKVAKKLSRCSEAQKADGGAP